MNNVESVIVTDPLTGADIAAEPVVVEPNPKPALNPDTPWQPPLVAAPEPAQPKPARKTPLTLVEEAVAFLLHDHAKHAVDPAKAANAARLLDAIKLDPETREFDGDRDGETRFAPYRFPLEANSAENTGARLADIEAKRAL